MQNESDSKDEDTGRFDAVWETTKQLGSELILPAICALAATAWEYQHKPSGLLSTLTSTPVFDQLSAYAVKLFYWGAFFAYFLRAPSMSG